MTPPAPRKVTPLRRLRHHPPQGAALVDRRSRTHGALNFRALRALPVYRLSKRAR
jgi:hypothetical protein